MGEAHFLHLITSYLIQAYKTIEFYIFKLFSDRVEKRIRRVYGKVGVEFVNDDASNSKDKHKSSDACLANTKVSSVRDSTISVRIHNKLFYVRLANQASLGMGETYMDHYWDCDQMTELSRRVFKHKLYLKYLNPWNRLLNHLELQYFNLQSKARAWEVGKKHYDTGKSIIIRLDN
jgi:hypothetical protein